MSRAGVAKVLPVLSHRRSVDRAWSIASATIADVIGKEGLEMPENNAGVRVAVKCARDVCAISVTVTVGEKK